MHIEAGIATMRFPFQDWPAILMGPQSAVEERVAFEQQMMGRDRAVFGSIPA